MYISLVPSLPDLFNARVEKLGKAGNEARDKARCIIIWWI